MTKQNKKVKEKSFWDYKQIRKFAWDSTFKKGAKAWIRLVAVCFLFSFIGAANSFQTMGIDVLDSALRVESEEYQANVDYLVDYVSNQKLVQKLSEQDQTRVASLVEGTAKSNSWIVRTLAQNAGYFQRNPGEVIVNLIIVAILWLILRFFIQNVFILGFYRFGEENRQQKNVRFRRLLAHLHLKNIPNLVWVMFRYNLALVLWYALFIIPGIVKTFEYCMVPFILAENPNISWKEAKKLSKQMTKGYKLKIFLTDLSYIYIFILQLIPIAGLLVATPLDLMLSTEYYFTLRNRPGMEHTNLPEKAFADAPYVKKVKQHAHNPKIPMEAPVYVLENINTKTAHKKGRFRLDYSLEDIIFMFFSFCLIGYVWEVCYEFVHSHMLVNRGTMYGPWIPIYGLGGLAIVLLLDRFKENKIKLFLMTMLVCAILEYAGSWALEFMFNSSYWNYKKMFMNVNGRICLAGLLAFGVGGLFGVYIAGPAISRFVDRFPKKTQRIIAAILCVIFLADIACCVVFGFNTGASVGGKIA